MQLIRGLENKHFGQMCTGYNSVVDIMDIFECKSNGKPVSTYALEGGNLKNACDDDRKKMFVGN